MTMAKAEIDDRFKKFGSVSFTGVSRVNDFIDYLEQGKVMGNKCTQCGKYFFPPRSDCYHSLSSEMEWFEVKGNGKLMTYSILKYAPAGFEKDLPYTIAVLDYGNYKVFGRIDPSIAEENIAVGMELHTAAVKLPDGQLSYVFKA
jgi:hypothetical protein